jgi:hypothetical protein
MIRTHDPSIMLLSFDDVLWHCSGRGFTSHPVNFITQDNYGIILSLVLSSCHTRSLAMP